MEFEWDEHKSEACKQVRGIDFPTASAAWLDPESIQVRARSDTEPRWAKIGKVGELLFTVIFTRRADKLRIIRVRRAHTKEIIFYGQDKKKNNG